MPKFAITFRDGFVATLEADTGDVAKFKAKHARKRELGVEEHDDPRALVSTVARVAD